MNAFHSNSIGNLVLAAVRTGKMGFQRILFQRRKMLTPIFQLLKNSCLKFNLNCWLNIFTFHFMAKVNRPIPGAIGSWSCLFALSLYSNSSFSAVYCSPTFAANNLMFYASPVHYGYAKCRFIEALLLILEKNGKTSHRKRFNSNLTPLSESGHRHKIRDVSFGFEQLWY